MKCPFCTDDKEIVGFDVVDDHLVILKKDENYHFHGPIEDKNKIHELLLAASLEIYKDNVEDHLLVFKNKDKKFTVQSSVIDKEKIKEFIFGICDKFGIGIKDE